MDKYTELRLVGQGMFGKAYLYETKDKKAKCIIKKVNVTSVSDDKKRVAHREVSVLSKLKHPGIVKYIESFPENGDLCIVMEYCENGDLQSKLEAQNGVQFPEDQIWDWFIQICLGVKYLHASKVMHRDLKPNNIFITKDGTLRIGDFGLAKVSECYAAMQHTFAGALGFCAPEMMNTDVYSSKCDIWSLGCVLYYMLMLKPPFYAVNQMRVCTLIGRGEYRPVSTTYSGTMRHMVARLLTVDPIERPSITNIMNDDHMRALANPLKRMKRVYGHQINNGVLQDSQGNAYRFDFYLNNLRDNNQRFDGLAEIFENYVYDEMMSMGLTKLPVPVESSFDPDYDTPGSFIFATENWQSCPKLMILIHGSGDVRAGQWARRLMMNVSVEKGTQLPYIKKALACEYAVMVLNTNDYRLDVEGCRSPQDHGEYVWKNYIQKSAARQIAIKSHSAGGNVVTYLLSKFKGDFNARVYANAYTGSNSLFTSATEPYARNVTKSWVVSKENLGTSLPCSGGECASAGTEVHSETPHKAMDEVFKFVALRFNDRTPGKM